MKIMKKFAIGVLFVGFIYYTADFFVGTGGKEFTIIEKTTNIERPVKDTRSFDEKVTDILYDWKEAPVGTESPYNREDGTNPVYDNMLDEEKHKPRNNKSPFFVPDTGDNVVEDNLNNELDKRD